MKGGKAGKSEVRKVSMRIAVREFAFTFIFLFFLLSVIWAGHQGPEDPDAFDWLGVFYLTATLVLAFICAAVQFRYRFRKTYNALQQSNDEPNEES